MSNWEEFLKLRGKANLKGMDTTAITLRIPKELRKVIIEDLRTLEDRDEKISFNEYVLLQLMNADGATSFTEFGPGKVLMGLVGKIDKTVETIKG